MQKMIDSVTKSLLALDDAARYRAGQFVVADARTGWTPVQSKADGFVLIGGEAPAFFRSRVEAGRVCDALTEVCKARGIDYVDLVIMKVEGWVEQRRPFMQDLLNQLNATNK
jgi:hypothetical protein